MELERRLLQQAAQLASARAELTALRRIVRRQRPDYSTIVARAELDAKGLLSLQLTGVQPSRRRALDVLGMPARRWQWARALAMLAGVHDGWLFHDMPFDEVIRALRDAAVTASRNPALLRQYRR